MTRRYYFFTVFCTGMAIMAVEMSASRLIAPFFGTSLLVWTNIIGLIMACLSAGYYLGGRFADKKPEPSILYGVITLSGCFTLVVPVLAGRVMSAAAEVSVGVFLGSLITVMGLFIVPFFLLGMISPFVIRLMTLDVSTSGLSSGSVYSVSTAGSILGTYLPALWCIPNYGTAATISFFASVLIVVGVYGYYRATTQKSSFLVLGLVILAPLLIPGTVRPFSSSAGERAYEGESLYNYIQVHEVKKKNSDGSGTFRKRQLLVLNEGFAIHSIYDKDSPYYPLVGSVWDYLGAVVPSMAVNIGGRTDVCIVGLAAGTVSKQMIELYRERTDIKVDGVEIDRRIVEVGQTFFNMQEKELNVHVADGRVFLKQTAKKYDLIITDAYRQPYIPFHLTTKEYFALNKSRLKDSGMVSLNVGTTSDKTELFMALAQTMKAVFRYVEYLPAADASVPFKNYVLIGSDRPVPWQKLEYRLHQNIYRHLYEKKLWLEMRSLLSRSLKAKKAFSGNVRAEVLTDDRAPVEYLTDGLIVEYLVSGKGNELLELQ